MQVTSIFKRSVVVTLVFTMLAMVMTLQPVGAKGSLTNKTHFSGEELFRGIFFLQGDVVNLCRCLRTRLIILDKVTYDFISLWIRLKLMTLKAFGYDNRMIGFIMELGRFEDTWGAKYPLLVKSRR